MRIFVGLVVPRRLFMLVVEKTENHKPKALFPRIYIDCLFSCSIYRHEDFPVDPCFVPFVGDDGDRAGLYGGNNDDVQ